MIIKHVIIDLDGGSKCVMHGYAQQGGSGLGGVSIPSAFLSFPLAMACAGRKRGFEHDCAVGRKAEEVAGWERHYC